MKKKDFLVVPIVITVILIIWILFLKKEKEQIKDYPQIEKSGTLHIVTDYNSIGYFVSGDTIAGFNHDLIQLIETYIPIKIEVSLESSLEKSIEDLKKGKYDVLARNIPVTTLLRDSLKFTEAIVQNRQVLIQRKKSFNDNTEPIRSHLDLAKKTIYISAKSPAKLRLQNLSHEIGDTIYIKEDQVYGSEQLAILVASKEIDYAVCDEKTAENIAKGLPEIDYATFIGFTHLEAWAVREQSPILLDSLNTWIQRLKKTDAYKKIYSKYYK
ncbi:MAG: transporter substrate-binding domain-containing protein [Prevotella sp.]|jgi:membrane-bound lytic murein transglycosylase MltF|nr:transporter substrate-binding domain-containing protein [Prevotella sp.]